jgi:hypothetical protein
LYEIVGADCTVDVWLADADVDTDVKVAAGQALAELLDAPEDYPAARITDPAIDLETRQYGVSTWTAAIYRDQVFLTYMVHTRAGYSNVRLIVLTDHLHGREYRGGDVSALGH